MTTARTSATAASHTRSLGGRAPAPDIARGLMLALIALANVMIYLHGRPYGLRQHIVEDDVLDRVVTVAMVTLVDGRAYPLFAALFGYGLVRIADKARSRGADEPTVTRTIRRRSVWLIVFGLVHALLGQTPVFAVLLPAHTLGLGARLGTAEAALLALVTWLVTVLAANALAAHGKRGPAEALLYRLRTPGRRSTGN